MHYVIYKSREQHIRFFGQFESKKYLLVNILSPVVALAKKKKKKWFVVSLALLKKYRRPVLKPQTQLKVQICKNQVQSKINVFLLLFF